MPSEPTREAITGLAETPVGTNASRPVVTLHNVGKTFSNGTVALDNLNLEVRAGEFVSLLGPSGCGKSTALKIIAGLGNPSTGGIDWPSAQGDSDHRHDISFVFQEPTLMPWATVFGNVHLPLRLKGISKSAARTDVEKALANVGLVGFADAYPRELSGGMKMRVSIARALVSEPSMLICDEPVSALDVSIQAQLINLLEKLQTEMGLTYLFIAHDLAVVRHIADRVAVMYLGKIVEEADRDDLYERPLHPYTQALLSAVPIPDPEAERQRQRIILTGDIASPSNPPSGCRFRTRCFLREQLGDPEICSSTEPQLVEHLPGHRAACHFVEPTDPASDTAGASTA
jgi:oligopeptide/dipeptide ABC transporter ATP-binding protein